MNMKRKIVSVITAITGHKVVIGESELEHSSHKHFRIPKIKLLEINNESLFSTIYPTGKEVRNPHKKLRKVKI